jgi:hypothetical protein
MASPGKARKAADRERDAEVREHKLTVVLLPGTFAVCRLPADAAFPDWATGEFVSVTRTAAWSASTR